MQPRDKVQMGSFESLSKINKPGKIFGFLKSLHLFLATDLDNYTANVSKSFKIMFECLATCLTSYHLPHSN